MYLKKKPDNIALRSLPFIFLFVLGLIACGTPGAETEEAIKSQIQETKREIKRLEKKASDLEARLEALNPEKQKAAQLVTTRILKYENFEHTIQVNGTIEAIREAFVGAEVSGRIETIHVREGDRVNKGDPLIVLNSSIIENTLAEVRTSLDLARTIYERRKRLWDKKIGSEVEFLQARSQKESLEDREKALQAQLELAHIKAPISGIIEQIFVKKGAMALPGINLIHVVDLSEIYVNVEISESYLGRVRTGDPVTVTFPARPDIGAKTRIHRMGNVINPENRTVEIQMKLKNHDGALKPNNLALIRLTDFSTEQALLVPSIVIKKDLQGEYVYLAATADDGWVALKTYIKTGLSQGSVTMVKSGLAPGQRVIVGGYNQVKNNQSVQLKDSE